MDDGGFVMEGSGSRGFNTSSVSGGGRRRFRTGRIRLSDDSWFSQGKKDRDHHHHNQQQQDNRDLIIAHRDFDRARLGLSGVSLDEISVDPVVRSIKWNDISLRHWLDNPERTMDAVESLHIFSQVVEIVNLAHMQGVVVHNVRPSCFVMSSFNRVSFIESGSCSGSGSGSGSESGSDSMDDDGLAELKSFPFKNRDLEEPQYQNGVSQVETNIGSSFPMKKILIMETNWYNSPEEANGESSSCASDIYRLGVLLFELFCTFNSSEEKFSTMSSLRHRVLPPQLLLKWPKEASFCLWLLHPDPNSRPKMGELLESEFLNERDNIEEREAVIEIREKIEEQELSLEFLMLLQQRKQEVADSLKDTVSFITSDIEEVQKQQTILLRKRGHDSHEQQQLPDKQSDDDRPIKRHRSGTQISEENHHLDNQECSLLAGNSRLMKNFKKLESAYFLTRQRLVKQSVTRNSQINSEGIRGSVVASERSSVNELPIKGRKLKCRESGWINSFLDGLSKYLSFNEVKVKADLKQGDLLNSSNLVCSLSFDRDGDFFATAGVNKKIKVFEYNSILNADRDIHYPIVELATKSKLSSICWNSYIKSQIASSNFDGVVQVWDVARSQEFMEMREHERRVWSVDFSSANPTMLASGSDDGTVKLWNINQGVSVGTIKTKANVCCVQFPVDSGRSIAFGSADHRIYYYDLRNIKIPLCTLVGHNKTVSYVKFVDSTTLVTSSTDNTMKLWDLSSCNSRVIDKPLQSFTGHTNVKNFVGLSVSDGYIATGSETNEVFIYHKALPMPALSFKFGSTDSVSGGDEPDEAAQFISSVCWRGKSPTLVAANSMGNIKLLEMV
ncbi:protein SPA1-RELATED 4-like isoform X1 [Impatiens glandulifera]|uniref:protein SPA1-RELATED 4-like isoform X1 n=1 Tax=Impatiens glandulifera TaxID=253017 RepID=UPI001FB08A6B|nr:protein SPA1-RELATED 4-like isoform X1 [Impatiens glandulifera]